MKKLNVIDYLVIFLLLAVVAFVGYKLLAPQPTVGVDAVGLSEPNCRFVVQSDNISGELAQSMKDCLAGEKRLINGVEAAPGRIFNSDKLLDAQVTAVEILGDGDFVSVRLTVEANIDFSAASYMLGRQEIRLGGEYILKSVDFTTEGFIVAVEKLA